MKQTAVEWLEEQYTKQITFLHREDFEQAKEMEKEQQGYSEEDIRNAIHESRMQDNETEDYIFEQFKKK